MPNRGDFSQAICPANNCGEIIDVVYSNQWEVPQTCWHGNMVGMFSAYEIATMQEQAQTYYEEYNVNNL